MALKTSGLGLGLILHGLGLGLDTVGLVNITAHHAHQTVDLLRREIHEFIASDMCPPNRIRLITALVE